MGEMSDGTVLEPPIPSSDRTTPASAPPAESALPAPTDAAEGAPADDGEGAAEEAPPPEPRRRTMVDDLRAERGRRHQAEQQLQQVQQVAQRQAEQYQAAQPLLEAVLSDPTLLAQVYQRAGVTAPAPEAAPATELVQLAQDLGLYDTRGQLDLKTAERVYQRQTHAAQQAAAAAVEQAVQQHVVPMQHAQALQQAQGIVASIAAFGEQTYGVPSAATIQVASALPPELLLQPNVANLVLAVAAGLRSLSPEQQRGARASQGGALRQQQQDEEPLFVERGGRRAGPQVTLDEPFRRVLNNRGMSNQDIAATLKNWRPDAPIPLE